MVAVWGGDLLDLCGKTHGRVAGDYLCLSPHSMFCWVFELSGEQGEQATDAVASLIFACVVL